MVCQELIEEEAAGMEILFKVTGRRQQLVPTLKVGITNVNSPSNVAHQSNNSVNPNSSVTYLNLNNSASNANSNISSQLLPLLKICSVRSKKVVTDAPNLLVEKEDWASKYSSWKGWGCCNTTTYWTVG